MRHTSRSAGVCDADGGPDFTAQFAEAQATVLAANIVSRIKGEATRPFGYHPKGQLSSIGHTRAVAEIYGFKLSGFKAWLLWRALYLLRIPTLARKSRLFLEWSWAMFFPPDISHFGYRRSTRRNTPLSAATETPVSAAPPEPLQPPPMPPQT